MDYTSLWKIARGDPEVYPGSQRPEFANAVRIGEILGDLQGSLRAGRYDKRSIDEDKGPIPTDPLSWIGPDVDVSGLRHIPFFPAGASAGMDRIRDGHIPPETAADVLPNNVRTIQVHGDCMHPHYEDGDIVFVNETDRAADGDKVIALVDMTARTCKVFRAGDPKSGRRPYLEPTNGEGKIETPRFRVHGVVIGFYRGEKRT